MTVGELISRLQSIRNPNLPIRVMQEHNVNWEERSSRIVQFESDVTDVGVTSKFVVIIGQELLKPDGETITVVIK